MKYFLQEWLWLVLFILFLGGVLFLAIASPSTFENSIYFGTDKRDGAVCVEKHGWYFENRQRTCRYFNFEETE